MKVTITVLLLGALLESVAACSIGSCSLTGSLTGIAGCTSYSDYINCLTIQSGNCTSTASDLVAKGIIDSAITSNNLLRAVLPCGGASLTSISSIVLILSVVAALIKTHF